MFAHFPDSAGDPILSLIDLHAQDRRPHKINLGVGYYYDDSGRVPRLDAVRAAEHMLAQTPAPCLYQPMAGNTEYRRAAQALLFGADAASGNTDNIATIQTVGGSGALRIGAELLRRHFAGAEVWLSDPSWDNHAALFGSAGFRINRYPYFDRAAQRVGAAAMITCLAALPAHSIVLLHPCCHNPTGADLEPAHWDEIAAIAMVRRLIVFFDMAYQGFGAGIEADRYALQTFRNAGAAFLVANSFSKTFSLYGERCGSLSVVCADRAEAGRALGQLETIVRSQYSSPPSRGGQLIARVLLDPILQAQWRAELDSMRRRVQLMRQALHATLRMAAPAYDGDHLLRQRGLFSQLRLSPPQVQLLRQRSAIYLPDSGRICLAGLNRRNLAMVAQALAHWIT